MLFRYNSDCDEAESLYGVNDQLEAEREKYGGQASYGGEDGRLPGYGGGGRGGQEDARLPGYRPRPAAPSKYGRDAKALELQDSVFLTTPPPLVTPAPLLSSLSLSPPLPSPSPPPISRRGRGRPIGEQEQNSKDKRELFSRRRTKKYSWAFK